QQKNKPPVAHCNNTVAASTRITNQDDRGVPRARHRFRGSSPYARRHMRSIRPFLTIVVGTALLAGCFTGKRAHFAEAAPVINDPAVAAVVDRLQSATPAPYTATYNVLTRFGSVATLGTVTQPTP